MTTYKTIKTAARNKVTLFLVFFLDSSTFVEFLHSEFVVLALSRQSKFNRVLGWAADINDAKKLILRSFTCVSKISTFSAYTTAKKTKS